MAQKMIRSLTVDPNIQQHNVDFPVNSDILTVVPDRQGYLLRIYYKTSLDPIHFNTRTIACYLAGEIFSNGRSNYLGSAFVDDALFHVFERV